MTGKWIIKVEEILMDLCFKVFFYVEKIWEDLQYFAKMKNSNYYWSEFSIYMTYPSSVDRPSKQLEYKFRDQSNCLCKMTKVLL